MQAIARSALASALLFLSPLPTFAIYRLVHIAGQEQSGYSGDGHDATAAGLNGPAGLALAPDGTLYIADTGNQRIRKVTTAGVISTVAGNGMAGTAGDGGPALEAALDTPSQVAVDAAGNVYIVTTSGVRRVDVADGHIATLFGVSSWRYSIANDALGDVFIVLSPFVDGSTFPTPAYLVSILVPQNFPSFEPISVQGIDDNVIRIYRAAAADPQHLALAFDGLQSNYGIAVRGRVRLLTNDELYALARPVDIGISSSGGLYLTGGTFYTGQHRYVIQRQGSGLASIAGGGINPVTDGALADTVSLDPRALAVASDDLIYFVQAPTQVYALRREAMRPGLIAGRITGTRYPELVAVLAAGDDGTVHYAQPDRRKRFRFRDLAPGSYRVYAHFDEEGLSCDTTNCGWSGAPDDCPRSLNDPVVHVTLDQPVHQVYLRLLRSFPCV